MNDSTQKPNDIEFSLYEMFVPLTNKKAVIFISIIGFIVYFNMLFNGFVWDDIGIFMSRNSIAYNFNLLHFFEPNIFNAEGLYRPLPALYFSVLYTMFGNIPFVYHLIQLIFHVACVIFVYLFFQKYFSKNIAFF